MNQLREWDGNCQRCYKPTDGYTMSMFDVALICFNCRDGEKNHPDYLQAVEAENDAVKRGEFNFPGIGYEKRSTE